jgi:eukaryotic-like serine/threonine-protein kinase
MGQVYLARSPGGRAVAVKVIRPDLAGEHGFRHRFAREVAAARGVNGVFTAAVIDADPDAAMPWMATAYVPGPSLDDAVKKQGPLPVESVLALGAGLAEGLQAIHAAGLVHRDLKPSNVLLAADGPRVIDFGISRTAEQSALTTAGMVMGSAGYMSPEQAMGHGPADRPTDVFSLGAVLAFAASGDSPFGTGAAPTLMYRVVHEAPNLWRVPRDLWPLLEWCMAKDPAARPTTDDLLRQLSHALDLLALEWLPAPVAAEISRYSPAPAGPADYGRPAQTASSEMTRLPVAATADWVPARAAGSGALASTGAPSRADSYPGRQASAGAAASPPPRRRWPVAVAAGAAGTAVAVVVALLLSSPGQAKPITGTTSSASPGSPATHSRTGKKTAAKSAGPGTAVTVTPSGHKSAASGRSATHAGHPQASAEPTPACSYQGQTDCKAAADTPAPSPTCSYDSTDGQDDLCGASSPSPSPTPTPTATPTCTAAGETDCSTETTAA